MGLVVGRVREAAVEFLFDDGQDRKVASCEQQKNQCKDARRCSRATWSIGWHFGDWDALTKRARSSSSPQPASRTELRRELVVCMEAQRDA